MSNRPHGDQRQRAPNLNPVASTDKKADAALPQRGLTPHVLTIPAYDVYARLPAGTHNMTLLTGEIQISCDSGLDNSGDEIRAIIDRPGHHCVEILDLVSSSFQWTASSSGTNEYYLESDGGGDPGVSEPKVVYEGGTAIPSGTAGSLSTGEWDWADNDSLGWNTVYVHASGGVDPDSQDTGYIQKDWFVDGLTTAWGSTDDARKWSTSLVLSTRAALRWVDDIVVELGNSGSNVARQTTDTDIKITAFGV